MAGLTTAYAQTVLDASFVSGDFFAWSVNGTSEFAGLARVSVGSWSAASSADPSAKGNAGAIASAAASAPAASPGVGYFAVFSASSGGTQKTDWLPLDAPKILAVGDTLSAPAGSLKVTLT